MPNTNWHTYEEVARYLLDQIAEAFGLSGFEGKQVIKGCRSGTDWEIDAKGINEGEDIFFIVECRRYTTSRLKQESLGALAYRIHDTGAAGAILVSPMGVQEGGRKIAESENIYSITLTPNSTTTDYVIQFLDQIRVGFADRVSPSDTLAIIITDAEGNVVDSRVIEDELPQRYFIRYGNLPEDGKSVNAQTKTQENGISCYFCEYDEETESYIIVDDCPKVVRRAIQYADIVINHPQPSPINLLVSNDLLAGKGSDGEPLLGSAEIVSELRYDKTQKKYFRMR